MREALYFLHFLSEFWSLLQPRSSFDSQPADENIQANDVQQSPEQEMSFTEVHAQLAPESGSGEGDGAVVKVEVGEGLKEDEETEKEVVDAGAEEALLVGQNLSLVSEGVSSEHALSSTVLHEDLRVAEKEEVKDMDVEVEEDLKEFLQK